MKLSIVATLYQSAPYVTEFHRRASAAAKELVADDYEIILVNDGSPDNSLDLAVKLVENDPHLIIVDLSRNFGHHKAMMTGLAHAKGELVFLIDSDLEEEPEWLFDFYKIMKEQNCDVVYGVQRSRKGGWFERVSGHFFYFLMKLMVSQNFPKNIVTARLMKNYYVNSLLLHTESEVFLAGLWFITGYKQIPFIVHKKSTSKTTYSIRKKIAIISNSITSFTSLPLNFIFYSGLFIFFTSIMFIFYLFIFYFFIKKPLSGWVSVIASIWLLGGLTISYIGIIGIYLSKIFHETKGRPYTIIKKIYSNAK